VTTGKKPSPSQLVHKASSHDKPCQEEDTQPDLGLDLAEHKLQFEVQKLQHEVDSLKQRLQESIDTHKLRLNYANKVFLLVLFWLLCVITSVFLAGIKPLGFVLSDNVLIAFITSTTLNVVGLFAIVAKWMFPQNGISSRDKKADG